MSGEGAPCGACRGLRRNCLGNCLFAPYFSSDEIGMDQFSAIHEIFGHNGFVKLLRKLLVDKRNDVMASILYQAQAQIDDRVHGCSSYILALQQENENLRQQLAVSHAELAERRSLGEASRNIDIAEYANGKQSSISNNKNFMIPDDEKYSFLIPSSISNNNLIPSSISNNNFMIPHNEQYSFLGDLQPIISQDVALNNYQQAADESPTFFPMCMQRGCMSCDIRNHFTVKQMDTEMEMGSFQFCQDFWTSTQQGGSNFLLNPPGEFGKDRWKSTQHMHSNIIINPPGECVQSKPWFPSF